jgi:hypothetical protein
VFRGQVALVISGLLLISGCSAAMLEPVPSSPTQLQFSTSAAPTESGELSPATTESATSQSTTTEPDQSLTASPFNSPAATDAKQNVLEFLLASLRIEPEVGLGYQRKFFLHWIDQDSDGCNTRAEVLIAESLTPVSIAAGCKVTGSWLSLYDLVQTSNPAELDIDHMIPLKEAWDSGAHSWDFDTRKRFANDLGFEHSLIAVTASSNRSKSDRDPSQWLPSNNSYHCEYAYKWLATKYRWRLSIDSAEALSLGRLVATCPSKSDLSIPKQESISKATLSAPNTDNGSGNDPRFSTCREALANGYGPYVKGIDPEYDWYRDGDKDGIVCE